MWLFEMTALRNDYPDFDDSMVTGDIGINLGLLFPVLEKGKLK